MAVCIYIGNALKDLVCAPRPNGMGHGDVRPKVIHSNAEAASYALVGLSIGLIAPLTTIPTTPTPYYLQW